MNNFEVIIGIEIHIELNTKSKMFSASPNDFNSLPNTNISPTDVGYPGALPVVNKEAVVKAIKLAKALNMDIDTLLRFDRKHYFYTDLPKGFQITQQFHPIGKDGILPLKNRKEISVERIHLEEDTAKSTYQDDKTYLNYNRAGVPLIEVVTDPVMHTAKEAVEYIDGIRKLAQLLNISDAKMEEGSLRADVNISLRPYGQETFGTKVEIKNINSLSNVEKAINFEIKSQTKDLLEGKEILQATKNFNEEKQSNVVMRIKTEAADYRYFPEPNIPAIQISQELIDAQKDIVTPWELEEKLLNLGVDEAYIDQLINDPQKLEFIQSINGDKNKVTKVFFAEVVSFANNQNSTIQDLQINPSEFEKMLYKLEQGIISGAHVKKIVPLLINNANVEKIIEDNNFKQISDEKLLNEMLDNIIESNKDFIEKNKDRPERLNKFLLGQIMKVSKGQANPVVANKLLNIKMGA